MPQVSLYFDDATMEAVRTRARLADVSLSKYVVRLVERDVDGNWPEGYWNLFGAISDDTFAEPEELSFALDGRRGAL